MAASQALPLAEITNFLYREARLLDTGRLEEWLELFDDDVRYFSPSVEWVAQPAAEPQRSPDGFAFDLFNDDKPSLRMRIDRLLTGLAYSELPHSITQHMITNVEVAGGKASGEFVARSNFAVLQVRPGRHAGAESLFFGRRKDDLRQSGSSWRIFRREIHLAHDVLPRAVSVLF